jgi:hypothetical protein
MDHTEDLHMEKEKIREDAELDVRNYICLLDQKRQEQRDKLQGNFDKNYQEIKEYFQELTSTNLTLIKDLSSQSFVLKKRLTDLFKRFRHVAKQTEANRQPVRLQTRRLASLKQESNSLDKEKASFARLQKSCASMEREEKQLLNQIKSHEQEYAEVKETSFNQYFESPITTYHLLSKTQNSKQTLYISRKLKKKLKKINKNNSGAVFIKSSGVMVNILFFYVVRVETGGLMNKTLQIKAEDAFLRENFLTVILETKAMIVSEASSIAITAVHFNSQVEKTKTFPPDARMTERIQILEEGEPVF